jgi:pyruvate,water dikinase
VFHSGAEKAHQAGEALVAGLRRTRFGVVKAGLARFLISRTRELGGLREMPKFTIVRMLGIVRDALRSTGAQLAASGLLAHPDDIFFLHLWELEELAEGRLPAAQEQIERRRQAFEREMSRRRVPRILLSDGTTYYDGSHTAPETGEDVLTGSPVSAGTVEGTVRVILDPHGSRLLPGEILVCPATDPAWTPLFLAAGGLVMEVGGMMTHGSVVAREYGIPAVVGVNQATTRLKTGQRIRVDGSLGRVQLLEENTAREDDR